MQIYSNLDWQLWYFITSKYSSHVCKTACTSLEVFNLTQQARTGSVSCAETSTCVCILKPRVQLQHYREVKVWLALSLLWHTATQTALVPLHLCWVLCFLSHHGSLFLLPFSLHLIFLCRSHRFLLFMGFLLSPNLYQHPQVHVKHGVHNVTWLLL